MTGNDDSSGHPRVAVVLVHDHRPSRRAREEIESAEAQVLVSSASGWEMEILPVTLSHALEAGRLPGPHRDPFDRVLAAQSRLENLPIVTRDPVFAAYGLPIIW